ARERLREVVFRLLPEALQIAQLVLRQHAAQIVDRPDTQLRAQALERLGSEALDAQQRDDRRRVLLPQRLELRDLPGLDQLANLVGRALSDALDLLQLLHGQLAQVRGLRGDRLGRAL